MTLPDFIRSALLVPFVEKGRDYSGWDCWGLAYCCYRDVYGIDLPEYLNYSSTRDYAHLKQMIDAAKPLWDPTDDPTPGDLALFNISGQPCHVGVMVDKKRALHTEKKVGTFIEPLNGLVWGERLEGIYKLCPII